jgi:hypothetical protein
MDFHPPGRHAGCRVYDYYGYEPFGAPGHLASFSRFKRQFGGSRCASSAPTTYFLDRLADVVIRRETRCASPLMMPAHGS